MPDQARDLGIDQGLAPGQRLERDLGDEILLVLLVADEDRIAVAAKAEEVGVAGALGRGRGAQEAVGTAKPDPAGARTFVVVGLAEKFALLVEQPVIGGRFSRLDQGRAASSPTR